MIYSIPYIIVVAFYGVLASLFSVVETQENKRIITACCVVVFVFFFGFRGFVGDDWTIYYPYFQKCSSSYLTLNMFQIGDDHAYEPGFTLLVLICKSVFSSYYSLNIICSIINVILLYKFLSRYIQNIPLGFMMYICMGGLLMSINLMRNTIAIMIIANAMHYIDERKPLQYFSLCTLALMFHTTSIIYFPIYFFLHKKLNKWIYLSVLIIGFVFFLYRIRLVSSFISLTAGMFSEKLQALIDVYTETLDASRSISIGLIERTTTGILIFCYYEKIKSLCKDASIFINSFLIYFFFYFYFWEFDVMSSRLANLFTFAYWIIWPYFILSFSIKNNRTLFIWFISIYSVMKIIGISHFVTYDYDNILYGSKSYNERVYIHDNYEYYDH